ncbi:hypothetical protein [Streptomyces sp. NBC_01233]|uniref:hypothetical protein n=1 Tax=Streptomyces sp. NBC_01233 TaxID=2903787 RepID=UPI002E156909|nr:hypothetical protein OG332_14290 [Streptomyces sp. NBC_01233]
MIGTYRREDVETKLHADARLNGPEVGALVDLIDEVLTEAAECMLRSADADWQGLFADEVVDMLVELLIPIADRPHVSGELESAAVIFRALCNTLIRRG